MEGYSKALNVSCAFCHAESKTIKGDMDYASDDKPEKEITRMMMKLTAAVNKDYFDYTIVYKAGEKMAVRVTPATMASPDLSLNMKKGLVFLSCSDTKNPDKDSGIITQ
jgi:hypothetical protein